MSWFHKAKPRRPIRPERCERCHRRPPTEQIRMLWQQADASTADGTRDLWLCDHCANELRRGDQ